MLDYNIINALVKYETSREPLCNREDIRNGAWMKSHTRQVQYWPAEGAWIRKEARQEYQWFPEGVAVNIGDNNTNGTTSSTCRYELKFNSTVFCNLMANSIVMFIGDSITWEMYESLLVLLDSPIFPVRQVHIEATQKKGLPVLMNVCDEKNVTLIYRSSKKLEASSDTESIEIMLEEYFPTAIVLNVGAHYQPDDRFAMNLNNTLRLMRGWQRMCRLLDLSCPFFWRTTAPGIPDCASFTEPMNDVAQMQMHVTSKPMFNWDKFAHQNDIAMSMLSRAEEGGKGLNYDVIVGYEMDMQRPDRRTCAGCKRNDCLHQKYSDVADAHNAVFLHYLRSHRHAEDVARLVDFEYNFSRDANIRPDGMAVAFDPRDRMVP